MIFFYEQVLSIVFVVIFKKTCLGFWDGTTGKGPRFQATRPFLKITRGTHAKGRRRKPLPDCQISTTRIETFCGKADLLLTFRMARQ